MRVPNLNRVSEWGRQFLVVEIDVADYGVCNQYVSLAKLIWKLFNWDYVNGPSTVTKVGDLRAPLLATSYDQLHNSN